MSRISIKDALRLGIMPTEASVPARAATETGRSGARVQKSPVKRKTAKAGRHPVVVEPEGWTLTFHVPVDPRSKQRARTQMSKAEIESAFMRAQGNLHVFRRLLGEIKHRSFTPTSTRDFEGTVAQFAAMAMRSRLPFDVPVALEVHAVFAGDAGTWPTDVTDPDLDNVEKAVFDALKGITWVDDRLVVVVTSVKSCGPTAGVHVRIWPAAKLDALAIPKPACANGQAAALCSLGSVDVAPENLSLPPAT